ncbi:MAG: alkaline phosphatase [Deltaproteobacteria bacterium]|nr:alkaline phosphatase [Deltaproteobacteria bacterium]
MVTTTFIGDATPAAFGAPEPSRDNAKQIINDYLTQSKPDVLFGGAGSGMSKTTAQAAGYTVIANAATLRELNTKTATKVSRQFGVGDKPYETDGLGALPHLREMVYSALRILDNNPKGFFLLIEAGRIEDACHGKDIKRAVEEIKHLDLAVQEVLKWLPTNSETLVIVTADHETGGLKVTSDKLTNGYPAVTFATSKHTAADVKVFSAGYGAVNFKLKMENNNFPSLITTAGSQRTCCYIIPDIYTAA